MAIADTVWPKPSILREMLLITSGVLLIGLAARVEIPLQPVPVTGQTFAVLLVAALYGARRGSLTLAAYVGAGAVGLPLFAGGAFGLATLFGPTGGYLVGFIAAAWVTGYLTELEWDRNVFTAGAAMLLGTATIYVFGLAWLAFFVGTGKVIALGLAPFLIGDLLKVILAALALPAGRWFLGSK